MAKIKGICKNIDACDLAADKIEQEAEKSNFVCSECGKPLYQSEKPGGGGVGTGGDGALKKKLIAVAAIVVIGGGTYFGVFHGKTESNTTTVDTAINVRKDTLTQIADPVKAEDTIKVDVSKPKPSIDKTVDAPKSNAASLGCASYDGPMNGGKPHGGGGVLTFKRSHTIDLKDGKGSVLEVNTGDQIVATKFDNGVLKQGELQRKTGERKFFTGVSEKL